MNTRRALIVFLGASLLLSCEPQPVPIRLPIPPARLVVSSQVIPGQALAVALTRTFSVLEGAPAGDSITEGFLEKVLVENALVTVSYRDRTDTLRMLAPGLYGSASVQQYDHETYTLYARDSLTGETVTARSVMQPPVAFETIRVAKVRQSGDETDLEVSYSFRDDPAVRNWYVVNYLKKVSLTDTLLHVNLFFRDGSSPHVEFDLLSDENLADSRFAASRLLTGIHPTDTVAVSIANISEGYYQFLNLYKRSGNLLTRIAGEPVEYPTNVQNGYGYFTTHLPDIRVFDLNENE